MASIKEFLKVNLKSLSSQLGGSGKIAKLPAETLIAASAHTDDVLAITTTDWVVDIPDMDPDVGYEIYDKHYELLYNETTDLGLEYRAWGTTERDIYLLYVLGFGEYVYMTYRTEQNTDRVLLLIKF